MVAGLSVLPNSMHCGFFQMGIDGMYSMVAPNATTSPRNLIPKLAHGVNLFFGPSRTWSGMLCKRVKHWPASFQHR